MLNEATKAIKMDDHLETERTNPSQSGRNLTEQMWISRFLACLLVNNISVRCTISDGLGRSRPNVKIYI